MALSKSFKGLMIILGVLMAATLAGTVATWSWGNAAERLRSITAKAVRNGSAVDTRPLDAAQQVAQLAETRSEKVYASEALRLADYSVDFAFAAAIREAANAPVPTDSNTRAISARLAASTAAAAADSIKLAALMAEGGGHGHTDAQQQQIDLTQAQLELDHDDADDARQDLIRAGGDRLSSVKRLRAEHDTSQHAAQDSHTASTAAAAATTTPPAPSIELTKAINVVDQGSAWSSLDAKRKLLVAAQQRTLDRVKALTGSHDTLEKQVAAEKAKQEVLHVRGNANAGVPVESGALALLHDLSSDQRDLAQFDRRIENEQDLATLYGNWVEYVHVRQQKFVHGMLQTMFFIFVIIALIVLANEGVQRVFSDVALQHRRLHTLRTIMLFVVQAIGVAAILLLVFGMPNNFATVIALAGAGLALALQDFIVGFFGWFILMGKDGIRPGDWVEINGVGGEVLEVGVFQTVLLETSNWSESAHPTGRKVSFVNNFAIEGHYFNFSTSGQWLWDELDVQVPDGVDPYAIAEEIQRLATAETSAHAEVAEEEWRRVVPTRVRQPFTAIPSVSVRPSSGGVTVMVRYLTQASERQALRARMYRAMIELLHGRSPAALVGSGENKDLSPRTK